MKLSLKNDKKTAFGIFQDGLKFQLAELELSRGKIHIKNLDEIILNSPVFPEINSNLNNFPLSENDDLDINNFENFSSSDIQNEADASKEGYVELRKFLAKHDLSSGIISMNCEDEFVEYFHFTSEFGKKNLLSKLKKELLTKEEIKDKNYNLVYQKNKDKSGLAIVHRGNFELLRILTEFNPILSPRKKFFYSYILTNEINLLGVVRNCYQVPEDQYLTIVYIGVEYKVGIVIRNNQFIKTFSIIAPPADPETYRNTIYSKIILEQDKSDIPITQNILFAGKFSSDADINFFREQLDSGNIIDRLTIFDLFIEQDFSDLSQETKQDSSQKDQSLDESIQNELNSLNLADYGLEENDYGDENSDKEDFYNDQHNDSENPNSSDINETKYSLEDITNFIMPISLAWHSLMPKRKFLDLNLLPTKIIENQKYFKISWHGFIILILIFHFAFSGTIKNLQFKQDILKYRKMNYRIENELSNNRILVDKLNNLKKELSLIESNMNKITNIVGNRNQWSYVLKIFSENFQQNPISWITNLSANNSEIQIEGYTTEKRNIVTFANLLPEGKISNITKATILDRNLWDFSLSYSYPDKKLTDKIFTNDMPVPDVAVSEQNFPVNRKELYQEILSIYLQGNYKESIRKFENYIKEYPDYPLTYNAHYNLGESYYLAGNYAKALAEFKYILSKGGSKVPDALLMSGNVFLKTNQKEKAIAAYRELISRFPKHNLSKVARYKLSQDNLQ